MLDIRKQELNLIRKSGFLSSIMVVLANCTPFFVAMVTFTIYILMGHELDAQKAFVSIALFNLLRIPLNMIPNMITSLILVIILIFN